MRSGEGFSHQKVKALKHFDIIHFFSIKINQNGGSLRDTDSLLEFTQGDTLCGKPTRTDQTHRKHKN